MILVTHIIFLYMVRTVFGNMLLYKINDAESIYITNKSTSRLGQPKSELIGNGDALVSLLSSSDSYVLVGEVDRIYNVSRGGHEEIVVKSGLKRLTSDCNNAYQCQNYIRAAFPVAKTNNIAPFSFLNSVYFFHSTTQVWDMFKQDYVFNGTDVVFKDVVRLPSGAIKGPNFRTAFGHEDKVYTFFSESEIVHQKEIFFKTFESYVGEVCAEDDGKNANDLLKRFVSFKKTNINCYLPDYAEMAHTKYTEIQQVTRPIEVMNQNTGQMDQVFYAVFSARRREIRKT
ncbi:hypothetical protein BpHYR1_008412 [Brachionus plicatilis]|uniref:Sema domain-containing protein n=1 Tax=Brachionus plicatilis TaxID=10195 RepID=A0A3M7SBC9_BRAPC|nr:hypothetical protein BpHYR1_008412 [Brachionus plicatilis]